MLVVRRRFPSRSGPRFRLLADGDAVLEQLVVDEPGATNRPDQELGLCRRRVEPVCVAFQHVRPSSLQQIVMCPPHPIPAEGEGEFSPTFVKSLRKEYVVRRSAHRFDVRYQSIRLSYRVKKRPRFSS